MSLNNSHGINMSGTISHNAVSTGFPEGVIVGDSLNARKIIWMGVERRVEMPPINSEEGSISGSDSNIGWSGAIPVWEIVPKDRMNPMDLGIYYVVETIKEAFKVRKGKVNPGVEWSLEGIVTILFVICFLITTMAEAWGIIENVPGGLIRITDMILGALFGRASSRVKPPR